MLSNKKINIKVLYIAIGILLVVYAIWHIVYQTPSKINILYATDISVNGDFDDYFDLVSMQSLEDVNLKIIVDGNDAESKDSGLAAIEHFQQTIGKSNVLSACMGRDENLSDLKDDNVSDALIQFLNQAEQNSVDIVTVGSLRDIAALYNHSPAMFQKKVNRVWVFAGDAQGTMTEYNVRLDETAFLRIMNAQELDIYWIPCFQNGLWTTGTSASYFTAEHKELFKNMESDLLLWFLYRFEKCSADFEEYLAQEHDTSEFMDEVRNLWCAPLFPMINGTMDDYLDAYNRIYDKSIRLPYGFVKKKVMFLENGKVIYGKGSMRHVFEIYDYREYMDFSKFVMQSMMNTLSDA